MTNSLTDNDVSKFRINIPEFLNTKYQYQISNDYEQNQKRDLYRQKLKAQFIDKYKYRLAEYIKNHKTLVLNTIWGSTLAKIKNIIGKGFIGAMCGQHGTGKTQFGIELCLYSINNGITASYIHCAELKNRYTSQMKPGSVDSAEQIISDLSYPRFLVLDEFEWGTNAYFNEQICTIIQIRYDMNKDTFIINNRNALQFQHVTPQIIQSRIKQKGGIIDTIGWRNWREVSHNNIWPL